MRKFLSSTFNSDTLQLDRFDPLWRKALLAVLVAAGVFGIGEGASRFLLGPIGRGWEYWHPVAAMKFEHVRKASTSHAKIRTLVVGDSTAAADIAPAELEAELGPGAWNAAWSGNFPLAFDRTTLPLLEDDGLQVDVIVAAFIPAGFSAGDALTSSEAGLVASTYVQKQGGASLTGDYAYLARWRSAWPIVMDRLLGREQPASVRNYGYEALSGSIGPTELASERLGNTPASLTPRRLDVVERLVKASQARGALLVLVVPPSLTRSPERVEEARLVSEAFAELAGRARSVIALDFFRHTTLLQAHFADINHLNIEGARILSREVGRRVVTSHSYADTRQVSQQSQNSH